MKPFAKINIFILLTLLTFSCYKPVEFIEVQKIGFNFKNNQGAINIFLKIYNPNFYKIKIIKSDLDIYLNKRHLGKLDNIENISIAGQDTSLAEINLELKMADILLNADNFYQIIKNPAGSTVKILGTITGKTIFGKKTIHIDETKKIMTKNN
jgi:LEA14-like dessication related protein